MHIIPAIDLQAGQCVRLYQGDFDQVTHYAAHPEHVAQDYAQQGAQYLHVVDLDGAKQGASAQTELIISLAQSSGLKVQTGGGLRNGAQIEHLLSAGVHRAVIGSLAVTQPELVQSWITTFGPEHIVLALDIHWQDDIPMVATHGWQQASTISLWSLLDNYLNASPLCHVLCTDIQVDGTLAGPNYVLYQQCVDQYPQLHFQASGGISAVNELSALKRQGVEGVIIGKALYEKRFTLTEALQEVSLC